MRVDRPGGHSVPQWAAQGGEAGHGRAAQPARAVQAYVPYIHGELYLLVDFLAMLILTICVLIVTVVYIMHI